MTFRKLHILISLALAALVAFPAEGQQEWTSTQYLFNLYDVNAAYAGNHRSLSAALRHRSQWTGIDGAPVTQAFSLHTPVAGERLGLGMRIHRETIGARSQWLSRLSAAYRIPIGNGRIAFALAGGMWRQQIDPEGITARDWSDEQLARTQWNSTSWTADAAVFVNLPNWFAGVEAARLNRSGMGWTDASQARSSIHLNAVGGYYLKLSENDLVALTSMLRWVEPGLLQVEGNLSWLWNNRIWLGAGYRSASGPVALVECNVTRQFRIGYSYDYVMGPLQGFQTGSHEVFIAFNSKPRDDRSIRQF